MTSYLVPEVSTQTELVVKKSRFIGFAFHASERDSALNQLADLRKQFPDARHHCWAYLLGAPNNPRSMAMSDDGEPSGTAGKPILSVMQHHEVGDIMLVVVRYFGGTKLGAGGLVRAYSATAQALYDNLPTQLIHTMHSFELRVPFDREQKARFLVERHFGRIVDYLYTDNVRLMIEVPESHFQPLELALSNFGDISSQTNEGS